MLYAPSNSKCRFILHAELVAYYIIPLKFQINLRSDIVLNIFNIALKKKKCLTRLLYAVQ